MNKLFFLPALVAIVIFSSCQKEQTEAERNAEVERQVQDRLAAERVAAQQQQLAQREADVAAREKAAAGQDAPAATEATTEATTDGTEEGSAPASAPQRTPFHSAAHRMRDSAGNAATATYSTFYGKLEPHGDWLETSNYGYVWQPREAQQGRSWRPYTNGHWVYTDVGWTWVSEEPFGWATYHYGRWTRLRNIGWVWVPGDEWAPAWVSWRKSNDYVGWAPLPPEARFEHRSGIGNWADNYYDIGPEQYAFVSTRDLGAPQVERALVPSERNITIVNQTTNVTNITYSNTTIVTQGPNYEEVRVRSQQPIPRLRMERQVGFDIRNDNPRAVVTGEVIQMAAPIIAVVEATERPRTVRQNVRETVVEGGWEGIKDRQAVERTRAKMRGESTPPPEAPPRTFVKPVQAPASAAAPSVAAQPASSASPSPSAATAPSAAASAASPSAGETAGRRQPRRLPPISPTPEVSAPVVTPSSSPRATSTVAAPAPSPSASATAAEATRAPRPMPRSSATAQPTATASVPPAMTPAATATKPEPSATPSALESQGRKFQPRRVVPLTSPAPPAPAASTESSVSAAAPSPPNESETRDQGRAGKEARKRERAAENPARPGMPVASPASSPASTASTPASTESVSPSPAGTVSSANPRDLRKEEKKDRRRERRAAGEAEESPTASPSVSP